MNTVILAWIRSIWDHFCSSAVPKCQLTTSFSETQRLWSKAVACVTCSENKKLDWSSWECVHETVVGARYVLLDVESLGSVISLQNCFIARNQNIYLGPGTDQKAIKNLNLRAGQSMWFGRSKGLNCIVQREKITYLRLILSSSGRWSKKLFILWQHFPRSWENIHWQ